MDDFEFRQLDEKDKEIHAAFMQEFIDAGENYAPGAAFTEDGDDFEGWLKKTRDNSNGLNLERGKVPSTQYFLVRKGDNKIVGALDLRHQLNEYLLVVGGNIGYGVAPSERRKGYATKMLQNALEICRKMGMTKVLLTCNKTNIASAKTIQRGGGVLENEVPFEDDNIRQRYWITL